MHSPQDLAPLEARLAVHVPDPVHRAELLSKFGELIDELVASDAVAKASIDRARGKPFQVPTGGMIQLGFFLYWVKYPPPILQEIVSKLPKLAQDVWEALRLGLEILHPPTVTTSDYEYVQKNLHGQGVIDPEGQVLGNGTFQGADDGWLWSFFSYLINLAIPSGIAPFKPATSAKPFEGGLEGQAPVRIAVIGDWGTGCFDGGGGYDPAQEVLKTAMELKPDYIIHLGDVYYAGTEDRPPPNEEQQHLLDVWPKMPTKRSFTLNSNHEMYGGANGYFEVALGRNGKATPFSHQNGFSYFVLTRGDWAFVGIDAAYFDPSSLYMVGGLGSPSADPQYAFLKDIAARFQNIVLFSHQTAMSTDGKNKLQLWKDVTSVVPAEKIRLWYWGHTHLGVVYGVGSALGQLGVPARCAGHSAIPIGKPWGLTVGEGSIDWLSERPVGKGAYPNRVRNGFALLTVTDQGVSEAFYDMGDSKNPAWSDTFVTT